MTRGPGYHLADERVPAAEHGAEQEEGGLAPPPPAPVDDEGRAPGGDLGQARGVRGGHPFPFRLTSTKAPSVCDLKMLSPRLEVF